MTESLDTSGGHLRFIFTVRVQLRLSFNPTLFFTEETLAFFFTMNIPVVDFGAYRLSEKDVADEQWQSLSTELKSAFRDVGFAFLRNTGITQEEVRPVR